VDAASNVTASPQEFTTDVGWSVTDRAPEAASIRAFVPLDQSNEWDARNKPLWPQALKFVAREKPVLGDNLSITEINSH
jgi:hypothetical protein